MRCAEITGLLVLVGVLIGGGSGCGIVQFYDDVSDTDTDTDTQHSTDSTTDPDLLPFGITPQGASRQDAAIDSRYSVYKTNFFATCTNGSVRVRRDAGAETTLSQGQGYGFLFAAYLEPDATGPALIEDLWQFVADHINGNGLMHFEASCDAIQQQNPSSEGDMDIVLGLLQAHRRWPAHGFDTRAADYLSKILTHETDSCGLKPGEWGGCGDVTNPSFLSTGFMRCFATIDAAWNDVIARAYDPQLAYWYDNYALPTEWILADSGERGGSSTNQYYYNAARLPLRLALDYLWWGNAEAKAMCSRIAQSFERTDPTFSTIGTEYNYLTGDRIAAGDDPVFKGPIAVAAMVDEAHQAYLDLGYAELKRAAQARFYQDSWQLLSLMVMTGVFTNPCE